MLRLLCLLTLLLPRIVLASCATEALSIWPSPDQPLPANGQVVLEGFGRHQRTVSQIAERSPRLVAANDEVPLLVVVVYHGQKSVNQAVLRPKRPLQPAQRYALLVTQPEDDSARTLPTELSWNGQPALRAWTVSPEDVTPPRWRVVPRKTGEHAERLGCGPEIHVYLSASLDDVSSEVQVITEVRPVDGGKPISFRLSPNRETIAVGQDMCSGAFRLQKGVRYSVRLIAVDMAGNQTPAPGDPMIIESPDL